MRFRSWRPARLGATLSVCLLAACATPPQSGHLFANPPPSEPPVSRIAAPRVLAPPPRPNSPLASADPARTSSITAAGARPSTAAVPPPIAPPRPAVAGGDGLSAEQRRQLAAMPLPNLPTLAPRDSPAAAPAATGPAAIANNGAGETTSFAGELAKAGDRIGLGDAELARIRDAQTLAAAGKESAALAALIQLNHELDTRSTVYVVQHGEALRQIAMRPEVYGNANLWPLIQDANRDTLADPRRLAEGQKLRIASFPSATAAADAIRRARAALQP